MSGLTERAFLMDRDNFQTGAIHGVLGFILAGNTQTEHGLTMTTRRRLAGPTAVPLPDRPAHNSAH